MSSIESGTSLTELMARFERYPLIFAHAFCPHHFPLSAPELHGQLISSAVSERYLAVAAPRESAKSTILAFVYAFHCITFKRKRFIVIIGNTFKKASMHLDAIKKEISENDLYHKFFPGISITKDAEGDSIIRHSDGFETKVLCRGVDQIGSIRGVKFGAYRPDLIIGDDMEDDELVKNPIRRRDLQDLFDEALIPAGQRGICQYIFIGTVLHDDCQLSKLVSNNHYPEYKKLFFKALQDDGTSLWPEKWSPQDLKALEKAKPSTFAKEYQNDPASASNTRFKKEYFRYYTSSGSSYHLLDQEGRTVSSGPFSSCKAAIACDLAWKENRDSDFCVVMPGLLTPESDILIYPYFCDKGVRPDKLAEILFSYVQKLEALTNSIVPIGFEKAMLENVTQWILKKEMRTRNKFLITKELKWDSDKISRIENRLQPRYSQGVIYHTRSMGDLENQLERFPSGTNDDLPDSVQGLVQLLQNPKQEKAVTTDCNFEKLRTIAINHKKPKRPKLLYGKNRSIRAKFGNVLPF